MGMSSVPKPNPENKVSMEANKEDRAMTVKFNMLGSVLKSFYPGKRLVISAPTLMTSLSLDDAITRARRPYRGEQSPLSRALMADSVLSAGLREAITESMAGRRPLDVDAGCGAGMHPLARAETHPHRTMLALEHTSTRFGAFAHHRAQTETRLGRPLANLLAVQANAMAVITHALPAASVDQYFFLYPNPYPKTRDRGRRWYAMPFFARVVETLKPGGTITFATNEDWYAAECALFLRKAWGLEVTGPASVPTHQAPRTHFEAKYRERGLPLFEVVARKKS